MTSDRGYGHKATIATSIMPGRIEAQQAAIDSWLRAGFEVLSANPPGEVEHLHTEFPGVRFVTVARPETGQVERPNVAIGDLLLLLDATAGPVCGIVNSDISFRVHQDFLAFIEEHAANGMVFGSRIDMDSDGQELKEFCLGFDYFFFDKALIPYVPPTGFCLGLPYWDYWLPMALLLQGVAVKRLLSPVAFHERHHSAWDKHLDVFGGKFLEGLKKLALDNREGQALSGRLQDSLAAGDLDSTSEIALHLLRHVVQSLSYLPANHPAACVTINEAAYADMQNTLVLYEKRMTECQRALTALHASSSWRLTEPLRQLKSALKKLMG